LRGDPGPGGRGHRRAGRRSRSPGGRRSDPHARAVERRDPADGRAAAAKDDSGLRLDPDACGPGLPEWLEDLGRRDGLAAAFDTRINSVPAFTGRASRPIAKLLKRHGYRLVAPESFLVSWHEPRR
jgi:hypothetical protein